MPLGVAVVCSYAMHFAFADLYVWARMILSAFILVFVMYLVEKFLVRNSIIYEIDKLVMNIYRNLWKR